MVLAGLLAGGALAALALIFIPKSYTATTAILVQPSSSDAGEVENGRTSGPINLDTEAQILTSSVVASQARDDMGVRTSLDDLIDQVAVTVPPNSAVLEVSFTDPDPESAAEGAAAFADAYLANRKAQTARVVSEHDNAIRDEIDSVNQTLSSVSEQIAGQPEGSSERAVLESQQDQLRQRLQSLNAQIGAAGVAGADLGEVITQAQVPTTPSAPDPRILGVSGLMIGLLLGVGAALVSARRDNRVYGRRELEDLGLDVLVPVLDVPADGSVVSAVSSRHDVNAIRMLRNSVLAQLPDHRGALLIVPISANTLAAGTAANLGATVARTGFSSVVVAADSRAGDGRDPASGSARGLGDVLLGTVGLGQAIQPTGERGLGWLPAGAEGSLSAELLQGPRVGETVRELRAICDVVIAHVAPASRNADAQSLAPLFDGVVLVASERETTTDEVAEAIEQFAHVSAKILGAVVVRRRTRESRDPKHAVAS